MLELFAVDTESLTPVITFAAVVAVSWALLTFITSRNRRAEERLERMGRPKSLAEIDDLAMSLDDQKRFGKLRDVISNLGNAMEPKTDLEKNSLKLKLAHKRAERLVTSRKNATGRSRWLESSGIKCSTL